MSDAAWNEVRKEAADFQHAIGWLIKRADELIPEVVAEEDRARLTEYLLRKLAVAAVDLREAFDFAFGMAGVELDPPETA